MVQSTGPKISTPFSTNILIQTFKEFLRSSGQTLPAVRHPFLMKVSFNKDIAFRDGLKSMLPMIFGLKAKLISMILHRAALEHAISWLPCQLWQNGSKKSRTYSLISVNRALESYRSSSIFEENLGFLPSMISCLPHILTHYSSPDQVQMTGACGVLSSKRHMPR